MHFTDLPKPVIQAAQELAQSARQSGLRLFVFGSFARGDARPQSDLDLGVEVVVTHEKTEACLLRLRDELDRWPSIRPVDLVDFRGVSPEFRNEATRVVLDL